VDFQDIYQEVFNRGFHYLDDSGTELARVKQWVNDAYSEICEIEDWPFLETTATGNAPLALTRCRNVESVVNTTDGIPLTWAPRRWVIDIFGTVPAGTPRWWYLEWSATDTATVNVAPTAVDGLSVRLFQHPVALSADGDTPVIPARFHWLIVEGAVAKAYRDADQYQEAQAVEMRLAEGINSMRTQLLQQGKPSPNLMTIEEQALQTPTGQTVVKGGEA
jgi:hypothetical protein